MRQWIRRILITLGVLAAAPTAAFTVQIFWGSHGCEFPRRNAESGARVIRTAIQQWQAANNETSCPTVLQLVTEKQLDPSQSAKDVWDNAYRLSCTADEVVVHSAGEDRQFGTADDIVVPRGQH
ncbi:MAG TPA: hypothetical protein VGM44_08730 [Polyangiaceae bacterium]|jgi:hypothetical protein